MKFEKYGILKFIKNTIIDERYSDDKYTILFDLPREVDDDTIDVLFENNKIIIRFSGKNKNINITTEPNIKIDNTKDYTINSNNRIVTIEFELYKE